MLYSRVFDQVKEEQGTFNFKRKQNKDRKRHHVSGRVRAGAELPLHRSTWESGNDDVLGRAPFSGVKETSKRLRPIRTEHCGCISEVKEWHKLHGKKKTCESFFLHVPQNYKQQCSFFFFLGNTVCFVALLPFPAPATDLSFGSACRSKLIGHIFQNGNISKRAPANEKGHRLVLSSASVRKRRQVVWVFFFNTAEVL